MPEMVITFRVPRWRVNVALLVGTVLAVVGRLTDEHVDRLAAWTARGVKVGR